MVRDHLQDQFMVLPLSTQQRGSHAGQRAVCLVKHALQMATRVYTALSGIHFS